MTSNLLKVSLLSLSFMIMHVPLCVYAQDKETKKVIARSVYNGVPNGYSQLGNTDLFYRQTSNSIDFVGRFSSQYYSSTYSDGGYKLAMQVGNNSAIQVDCLSGATVDSVSCTVSVIPQGELGRVIYTVTNSKAEDVIVSLGTHADVMIGSNDRAPISRRIDTIGNTYGLTMQDGNGAQLCVLFGAGLVGVNSVSDFWFGYYNQNNSTQAMVGNYSAGNNYLEENGSYDSGMGWCWKERTVPANSSVEFSYLIGVGDVNLEPNSTFEVTPEDPEGWNDLSRPHRLSLEGEYESPAGQNGKIQYAVEDSEEWLDLTEEIESGSTFTASLVAMFDSNKENHTIRFRTVDAVGNTSLLTPIVYKDVSYHPVTGIEEKIYNWGDSIYQTNLSCDLPEDQYAIDSYRNNQNAGIASFNIEGVFPYSIGRKTYNYTINPLPLDGEVTFGQIHRTYNGYPHCPAWSFTNESFSTLQAGTDYSVEWLDNVKPGTARLRVIGEGNFTNELTAEFQIDKGESPRYSIHLPNTDITFDDAPHGATISVSEGVGDAKLYYSASGSESLFVDAPKEIGSYDIYLEIAEGEYYYGKPLEKVSSFTIYQFDETEWAIIERINSVFTQNGQPNFWNLTEGITAASKLSGLKIEQGKVVEIDFSYNYLGVFPSELLAFPNLRSLNISGNNIYDAVENISYYVYDHPDAGFNLLDLNISNNQFYGNLGEMASHFPNLRSLHAEGNSITDISPVISENVWDLNYSSQYIYEAIDFDMSNMYLSDLACRLPQILFYDHYNRDYSRRVEFECSPCYGFTMQLWLENGYGGITFPEGQNVYTGENGTEFDVCDYSNNIQFRVRISFTDGDANFNNGLDITDLQAAILYAFGEYDSTQVFNFTGADTYRDYQINVQDIVSTVNLLLNNSWMYGAPGRVHGKQAVLTDVNTENAIWIEDGKIMLSTDTPIAAISIDLEGSADLDLSKFGMTMASKGGRTIAYSLNGGSIPVGISELGTCSSDTQITGIALSDTSARPVAMEITSNGTTSIESIMNDNEGRYEIYTPAGIRVSKLQKGVNIVKSSDKKVSKIFVR